MMLRDYTVGTDDFRSVILTLRIKSKSDEFFATCAGDDATSIGNTSRQEDPQAHKAQQCCCLTGCGSNSQRLERSRDKGGFKRQPCRWPTIPPPLHALVQTSSLAMLYLSSGCVNHASNTLAICLAFAGLLRGNLHSSFVVEIGYQLIRLQGSRIILVHRYKCQWLYSSRWPFCGQPGLSGVRAFSTACAAKQRR